MTVQSWFLGLDPALDYTAPARVLVDDGSKDAGTEYGATDHCGAVVRAPGVSALEPAIVDDPGTVWRVGFRPGKHWVEAVLHDPESGAERASERQAFEVKPHLRTRTGTSLVLRQNPVAKVKSPYVVKVAPGDGSIGRVDLYEFDNVGQLYRIRDGHLSNGQVTVQAATMAGQRKAIAEFAGDDRYVGCGTGANLFAPVAFAPTSPPSNTAVPVSADPMDQAAAPTRAASAAPRGELAYTGQDSLPVLTFAAVVLAAGLALTVAVRRRNRRV